MKEIVPELAVQDLAGAESLLCAVFGFARDGDMLRLNDQRLALVQADGPRGHGGIDHLALSVNDTDAALAHLIARGARLEETTPDGPKEIAEFWDNGVRYVFLQGPEGARIELCAKRDTPAEPHRPGHDHIGIPCTDIAASAAKNSFCGGRSSFRTYTPAAAALPSLTIWMATLRAAPYLARFSLRAVNSSRPLGVLIMLSSFFW